VDTRVQPSHRTNDDPWTGDYLAPVRDEDLDAWPEPVLRLPEPEGRPTADRRPATGVEDRGPHPRQFPRFTAERGVDAGKQATPSTGTHSVLDLSRRQPEIER
jgi:hypothetical protein